MTHAAATAADEGSNAFLAGLGEDACPYIEDYDGGDYWTSLAGLRQCWLSGWRYAWRAQAVARDRMSA